VFTGRAAVRQLVALLPLAAVPLACTIRDAPQAIDRLQPCTSGEGPADAYCGRLRVFENRASRQGRTIDLKIVVLPALGREAAPDPLFFLAGGPGQGAAQMGREIREIFRRVQISRDIVLVDQRGTGDSAPLACEDDTDSLAALDEPEEAVLARLRACLQAYDADPRLYTTSIAMDDLDDVRAFLGYARINLYGGSYGTRAALVYLRQHGARVRSAILDGVAPPDMRLPLYFARDAERALDKLVADCEVDPRCSAEHGGLGGRVRALVARLEREPARVRLTHPRTGVPEEVTIGAAFIANVVTGALYSPISASLLPALVGRAEARDFQGLVALAFLNERAARNLSLGMQLSVICAEDYPRVTPEDLARESSGRLFGRHLLAARIRACDFWPKGEVPSGYYEPVASSVPVLILSGDLDPITPPSWGEAVARHLPNARHIVVPGTGHGVIGTGCGVRLAREFIEEGRASDLDLTCAQSLKRAPFFLAPSGPDPTAPLGARP
jgi:pimeloyl-ACP methyl ester carboxylesterase